MGEQSSEGIKDCADKGQVRLFMKDKEHTLPFLSDWEQHFFFYKQSSDLSERSLINLIETIFPFCYSLQIELSEVFLKNGKMKPDTVYFSSGANNTQNDLRPLLNLISQGHFSNLGMLHFKSDKQPYCI